MGMRDLKEVSEMFKKWTVVITAQLGKFTKSHYIVHFK